MTFPELLERVLAGRDLTQQEAGDVMRSMMAGELSDAQIGGLLVALRAKGATAEELAGFASTMRGNATGPAVSIPGLVDTCGTGGGPATFNLSTGAAIVAAAAGVKVAKHGNRAVTSACGSADVLEALGLDLGLDSAKLGRSLEEVGIAFFFAPNHHPAMRHVGPARKALGVRTVFNQLGPLSNPAGASRQLIGVYEPGLARPMADALRLLGCERAYVVHSEEGLDEASPCSATRVCEVREGQVTEKAVTPEDFGIERVPFGELAPGATAKESASLLKAALSEPGSPRSRALVPNAALALDLAGVASSLLDGAERAIEAIRSGAAARKLEELVSWTS